MKAVDGHLERIAADEPHGVIRPAVAVAAQAVHRNDARVLQTAGNFGLGHEPLAGDRIVGVAIQNLLERHFTVKFCVQRDEDGAQPALGMRPQDAKSLAQGRGRAQRIVGCAIGVEIGVGFRQAGAETCQGGVERWVVDFGQLVAGGVAGSDRCQAQLQVTTVLFQMPLHQGLDSRPVIRVQSLEGEEVACQVPGLVQRPCLKCGDEL